MLLLGCQMAKAPRLHLMSSGEVRVPSEYALIFSGGASLHAFMSGAVMRWWVTGRCWLKCCLALVTRWLYVSGGWQACLLVGVLLQVVAMWSATFFGMVLLLWHPSPVASLVDQVVCGCCPQ